MVRAQSIFRRNKGLHSDGEGGFSLVVVLFFVGLIASIIAMNAMTQKGVVKRDQAQSAGWHLTEIAKAARIYVRDRSLSESDPYHRSKLTGPGIEISIDDLKLAGLLPPQFPETNILGQTARVFAANYPVNDIPDGPPPIANAFVFLEATDETQRQPILMQYVAEGAKKHGLYTDAPVFTADGTSIGKDCDGNGEPDYVLWDTNCLNLPDFLQITSLDTFTPGSLMAPAWRAQTHDTRAVMRYPQAENPVHATMMTALEMATPFRDAATGECTQFVQIYDYNNTDPNAMVDTGLCDVHNDVGSELADDRRFDLLNVADMQIQSIVAESQGAAEASMRYDADGNPIMQSEYASVDNTRGQRAFLEASPHKQVIAISGTLDAGSNVWATGRDINPTSGAGYIPVVTFADTANVPTDLVVDHNVTVSNGSGLDMRVISIANVDRGSATILDNDRPLSAGTFVAGLSGAETVDAGSMNVDGACAGAECGMVALSTVVRGGGGSVTADSASFSENLNTNALSVGSPGDTREGGVPSLAVWKTQGAATTTAETVNLGGTLAVNGSTRVQDQAKMDICFGAGCPNITQNPQDGIVYE